MLINVLAFLRIRMHACLRSSEVKGNMRISIPIASFNFIPKNVDSEDASSCVSFVQHRSSVGCLVVNVPLK